MVKSIFEEYAELLPPKLLKELEIEVENNKLTQAQIKKVLERTRDEYEKARIDPGEAIGVITAESFGEPGTQMTLNVFHLAGVSEVQVTQGLPRLIELFDARKIPSTPKVEVFLEKDYNKDPVKVKKVASLIKETTLGEIIQEYSLNLSQSRIELNLNKSKMKDLGITPVYLINVLKTSLKDITVKETKDHLILIPKSEQFEIQELYQLKEKCRNLFIRGVKGIRQVLPIKRDNEFVIICVGSNLEDIIKVEGVDFTRTTCNDIFMMAKVFGIEGARQTIIQEALSVIKNQGLDVDIRHIMLLADVMTNTGVIKGITRGGITGEKESVLARASFETPIKHLINASIIGEKDPLNSVIENVMVNQEIPVGTGLPDLVARVVGKNERTKGSTKTKE